MDQNIVKNEDGANLIIKFEDEHLQARLFDIDIKIEPGDLNSIEDSLMECDFKIKDEINIDIGPTVLHKPTIQYENPDTPEKPIKQQPKEKIHSKDKSTKKKSEILHTCKICGREFKRACSLKCHIISHSRDTLKLRKMPVIKLVTCPQCPEEFTDMDNYNKHIGECHKPFKCDSCCKEFDKKCFLKHHQCGQSDHKAKTCKEILLKCPKCPKVFTLLGNYNRHIKEYHNENSYICNTCGKQFKRQYSLKRHQLSGVRCNVRTGNFKCCSCNKQFSHRFNLLRHEAGYCDSKRYEGMYICDICDKGFPNRIRLMVHIGHHKRLEKAGTSK